MEGGREEGWICEPTHNEAVERERERTSGAKLMRGCGNVGNITSFLRKVLTFVSKYSGCVNDLLVISKCHH